MFSVFRNAWKIEDLRKKILFTAFIILLFRLGSAIPVPFLDSEGLRGLFENFEAEAEADVNFIFGKDYDLGDVVTVK